MARTTQAKGRITSIQYIHDPEAAKEWMNLLMEITKKKFLDQVSNMDK
jgi:hypothetical protein